MKTYLYQTFRQLADSRHDPAYQCLRHALRSGIHGGHIQSGQALPGERVLARDLDISRVTVRKAIRGLVEEGLLTHRHGAGTFVADRITAPLSRLTSFTEDLRARGLDPSSVFLSRDSGRVMPEEATAMGLPASAWVARLRRLRYGAGQPLAIEYSAVPQIILPDPTVVSGSLYAALDNLGVRPVRALQRLRAVNLNSDQARFLKVAPQSAGLALERRSFLHDGRVVEFTRSWYRGDMYDFVAELQGA